MSMLDGPPKPHIVRPTSIRVVVSADWSGYILIPSACHQHLHEFWVCPSQFACLASFTEHGNAGAWEKHNTY